MHHPAGERLHAAANGGAVILFPNAVPEGARLKGIYHATCVGPRPHHMAKYAQVRDALHDLMSRGLVARHWYRNAIKRLQQELADFELVDFWGGVQAAPNLVPDIAARHALDNWLGGSAYTVTGPYMGLISSTSYSAVANADTMSSHSGWLEAGSANTPTYTGPRKTMAFSAAATRTKSLSSALSFSITGTGTIKGVFMVLGSGASSTIDNTGGTLGSAGLFSGGDQPVVSTNTVSVTYSIAL